MTTAVHFGAGNIGRGFLGQLYWQSGWETVFVDVAEDLVASLNARRAYTLQIVAQRCEALRIDRVRAIRSADRTAVAEAIATCGLASTAVGVRALPHIAAPLAAGLALRAQRSAQPLNIVVCENLLDAPRALREAVLAHTPAAARRYIQESVGFVATVVSRMVPIVPESVRAADPLYVAAEAYCTLPVDAAAFVGGTPPIVGFLPVPNIAAHEERKLFCHNCGHALCAYAGHQKGLTYIAEAIADPSVRELVTEGLAETGQALIAKHGFDPAEHEAHVDDLLRRFANRALGDTVARVARDPLRKLRRGDRLVGAALFCLDNGVCPRHIIEGIRAALAYDCPDDPEARRLQQMLRGRGIHAVLGEVCGLQPAEELWRLICEAVV